MPRLRTIAFAVAGMTTLLLGLIAASYVFDFSIPWVNLGIAWVMVVVPSSLFVIATSVRTKR